MALFIVTSLIKLIKLKIIMKFDEVVCGCFHGNHTRRYLKNLFSIEENIAPILSYYDKCALIPILNIDLELPPMKMCLVGQIMNMTSLVQILKYGDDKQ